MKKIIFLLFTLAFLTMSGIETSAQAPGRKIVKHPYSKKNRVDKKKQSNENIQQTPTPQTSKLEPEVKVHTEETDSYWKTFKNIERNVDELNRLCPLQMTEGVILVSISYNWANIEFGRRYYRDKKVNLNIVVDKNAGYLGKNLKKGNMQYVKKELLSIFKDKFPTLLENLKKYKRQSSLESSYKPELYDISLHCILSLGKPDKNRYCNTVDMESSEM